jgi:hypothetical protein
MAAHWVLSTTLGAMADTQLVLKLAVNEAALLASEHKAENNDAIYRLLALARLAANTDSRTIPDETVLEYGDVLHPTKMSQLGL